MLQHRQSAGREKRKEGWRTSGAAFPGDDAGKQPKEEREAIREIARASSTSTCAKGFENGEKKKGGRKERDQNTLGFKLLANP